MITVLNFAKLNLEIKGKNSKFTYPSYDFMNKLILALSLVLLSSTFLTGSSVLSQRKSSTSRLTDAEKVRLCDPKSMNTVNLVYLDANGKKKCQSFEVELLPSLTVNQSITLTEKTARDWAKLLNYRVIEVFDSEG